MADAPAAENAIDDAVVRRMVAARATRALSRRIDPRSDDRRTPVLDGVDVDEESSEVFATNLIPHRPTFANFVYVFTQVNFIRYLWNTFFVSAVVTVVALFFHSMAGYALARLRFPGRDAIFLSMFATFLISQPVIIVPLFILARTLGLLDSYAGLIVPSIFNAFGIFLLRQFYLAVPRELEEAALIDGAGYFRIYWSIVLPLSRPILSALAILFFLANWNSFLWPLTITNNQDLWMVQVAIASFRQQYNGSWNYIMAASTVVALPTIAMFVVFQKRIIEFDQDERHQVMSRTRGAGMNQGFSGLGMGLGSAVATVQREVALDQPGESDRRKGQRRHGGGRNRGRSTRADSGAAGRSRPRSASRRAKPSRSGTSRAQARSSRSG